MAKSDSFFIRATVNMPTATNAFVQEEIDLGSFVNLGTKSSTLLRIRNVQVSITDTSAPMSGPYKTGSVFNLGYQLTTQNQLSTGLVSLADKSVIASGRYSVMVGAADEYFEADVKDNLPQDFTNGYLIGVDSIYLGMAADQNSDGESYDLAICIEAQLENASQSNSVALALSQQ
jgi:hypothetical protein